MDRPLATSDVLLLDCQSTGASPERGRLLEVAWSRATATDLQAGRRPGVEAHLVAQPAGERLPRRISRLTGIGAEDLNGAPSEGDIWRRLQAVLGDMGPGPIPAVAHFARFETAFLDDLHRRHGGGDALPVHWICTHEIACRLLPGLPRRGLKAVAGYLGHVVEEAKRAGTHVEATLDIWGELVGLLEQEGVTTLPGLREWMERTPPTRKAGREFAVTRERRLGLPESPGVYRMLGRKGQVLYVGKAASLRHRVNGYFQKRRHPGARTLEMLTQVFDVDTTVTATALEAALAEADEIKRLAPPYNVALRERERAVVFLASDLSSVSGTPDAVHRHGPLPDGAEARSWVALNDVVVSGVREDAPTYLRALGLREETPLDLRCAREGVALFRRKPALVGPLRRRLMAVGAQAWREHLAQREAGKEGLEEEHEAEDDAAERPSGPREPWTPHEPEQVVALIEGMILRGAHLQRRGRWLQCLSESAIAWETATGGRRLLVVTGGRVVHSAVLAPGEPIRLSPGHARLRFERSRAFDVATYDRLRVLTTELRRLVSVGRSVEVSLGPCGRLGEAELAQRLVWV